MVYEDEEDSSLNYILDQTLNLHVHVHVGGLEPQLHPLHGAGTTATRGTTPNPNP